MPLLVIHILMSCALALGPVPRLVERFSVACGSVEVAGHAIPQDKPQTPVLERERRARAQERWPPIYVPQRKPPPLIWLLPIMFGGLAAAGAQMTKQKAHEEEEPMSAQSENEFEYKFLRSSMGMFRRPEKLRSALEQENSAGWQLVEKFDDSRLRLRRPIECRAKDGSLGHDPYRSSVSLGEGAATAKIVLGVLFGVAVVIAIVIAVMR